MVYSDKHFAKEIPESPEPLGKILPDVLKKLKQGSSHPERSEDSSIRYEQGRIDELREQAVADFEEGDTAKEADIAEQIHESTLAIEALKDGRGHLPFPDK